MEDLESGNIEEGELETLDERLELDYQVGEDLKERIVPRAIGELPLFPPRDVFGCLLMCLFDQTTSLVRLWSTRTTRTMRMRMTTMSLMTMRSVIDLWNVLFLS